MNQEIFARYADIKKQIAELEDQLEELKPEVTAELKDLPNTTAKLPFGIFNLQKRAKWTYSEIAQQLERELKSRKKEEEKDGNCQGRIQRRCRVQGRCGRDGRLIRFYGRLSAGPGRHPVRIKPDIAVQQIRRARELASELADSVGKRPCTDQCLS